MSLPSDVDPLLRSYQANNNNTTTNNRSIPAPTIQHENEVPRSWWYGNARLRPNIGLTNSYEYSFCGAVHESIQQLRTIVVVMSLATILLILWTWLWHFLTLQWTRLILSIYLAFLAFLLGLSDALLLSSPLRNSVDPNGDDEHSFASNVTDGTTWTTFRGMETRQMLEEHFGILFHPVGRPALLLFMGSLCWSVKGIFETLLGFIYFLVAVALIFLSRESEFRKGYYPAHFLEENAQPRTPVIIDRTGQHGFFHHAWASVEKNSRSGEKQSLLDIQ